jgi:2-iminobutanoate/2-iminopropanoate deaminase
MLDGDWSSDVCSSDLSDIIKMTLWMKDRGLRHLVNPHWEAMFPDPSSRPARHALKADLEGGMLIQCDFIAVLDH